MSTLQLPAGRRDEAGRTRRDELDLLRALVVVGLVFFHTAVIFGAGEFPIKATTENPVATVFLGFGATWGMPLLFLIAGMGIWHSLRSRSPATFARERLRRLGVPLLVGLLALVPLQVWLGLRRAGDPSSYPGFYARFWDVRPTLDFPFVITSAPDGVFETGHLWFLICLLGFSLVLLPGFAWLRRPASTRLLERLGRLLARPGGLLLLPALPLAVVEVALGSETGHGGWNHGSYALLLVYGFLVAADPRTGEALTRQWRPAAALGLLLFLAAGAAAYGAADAGAEPFTDMDPRSMVFRLLKSIDGWLWVVAIVGLARARIGRRRNSPAQPPPHRADKPVNVTCWHQTVNVSAGREPHTSPHMALNADSCRSQPGSQALLGQARRSLQPSPHTRSLALGHWPHEVHRLPLGRHQPRHPSPRPAWATRR